MSKISSILWVYELYKLINYFTYIQQQQIYRRRPHSIE